MARPTSSPLLGEGRGLAQLLLLLVIRKATIGNGRRGSRGGRECAHEACVSAQPTANTRTPRRSFRFKQRPRSNRRDPFSRRHLSLSLSFSSGARGHHHSTQEGKQTQVLMWCLTSLESSRYCEADACNRSLFSLRRFSLLFWIDLTSFASSGLAGSCRRFRWSQPNPGRSRSGARGLASADLWDSSSASKSTLETPSRALAVSRAPLRTEIDTGRGLLAPPPPFISFSSRRRDPRPYGGLLLRRRRRCLPRSLQSHRSGPRRAHRDRRHAMASFAATPLLRSRLPHQLALSKWDGNRKKKKIRPSPVEWRGTLQ